MPSVSVVVCTRDRASLLQDCLRSLVAQESRAEFEVVVVDNGLHDGTSAVVNGFASSDSRFRLVKEPIPGLSRAKNTGFGSARGELVVFTDDDVVVAPGWVDAFVAFFALRPELAGLAGGPVLAISPDLSPWPPWIGNGALADLPRVYHGPHERRLGGYEWIWGANMGARRRFFEQVGGFDESVGRTADERGTFEDVELEERVRAAGGEVWYCPRPVVYHRVQPDAMRPRSIASRAFSRGANDYLRATRGSYLEPAGRVPAGRLLAALALPWALVRWIVWSAAFRATYRVAAFERGRRSAWAAGWCTAALAPGQPGRVRRAATGGALVVRDLAVRLTPS